LEQASAPNGGGHSGGAWARGGASRLEATANGPLLPYCPPAPSPAPAAPGPCCDPPSGYARAPTAMGPLGPACGVLQGTCGVLLPFSHMRAQRRNSSSLFQSYSSSGTWGGVGRWAGGSVGRLGMGVESPATGQCCLGKGQPGMGLCVARQTAGRQAAGLKVGALAPTCGPSGCAPQLGLFGATEVAGEAASAARTMLMVAVTLRLGVPERMERLPARLGARWLRADVDRSYAAADSAAECSAAAAALAASARSTAAAARSTAAAACSAAARSADAAALVAARSAAARSADAFSNDATAASGVSTCASTTWCRWMLLLVCARAGWGAGARAGWGTDRLDLVEPSRLLEETRPGGLLGPGAEPIDPRMDDWCDRLLLPRLAPGAQVPPFTDMSRS
jgi:hypothetical protein